MNTLTRFALALLAAAILGCQSAPSAPTTKSAPLIDAPATTATAVLLPFATDEGLRRLASADARRGFAALANQYEAQINEAFCGPTTAAIVLNAVHARSPGLPRDRDRLRDGDMKNLPPGAELIVPRYTPDNVIAKGAKRRAQVLGEPMLIHGQTLRDFGYQLRQFDELLRANGLVTRAMVVDDSMPEDTIRGELIDALNRPDTYAVINYRREAVGQKGGGHISPLGAYDAASDSFLVLDVNPEVASWVWMPTATLVRGMRTFDTVENRGYVIVSVR